MASAPDDADDIKDIGAGTDDDTAGLVAVIGMAGRFPGAADLDEYWRNLRDGIDSIARFSDDELRAAGVPDEQFTRPDYVPAGSAMAGFDEFDASFFGYTSREAEIIDPQHRVFLETCWSALEHAGYTPGPDTGTVGVFGGASTSAYLANVLGNLDSGAGIRDANVGMGNELGFLTTRVSYKLDLHGPSFPVQTACSSSLVAVHIARQSLLNYECDLALTGAVSFKTPPGLGYVHQDGGITSPDGRCRPFDAAAEGTLFTNGAAVVVLKRLEDALADGDEVYGVLRGSAVNNDGAVKASFSAPSVTGQVAVIADAIADAGVSAETVQYVEGHGSGTRIGDAIEIQALTEAFRQSTDATGFATIGSVKSNLGHLDAAAGMAGLIKVLLALRHETLPPTVNFVRPNPEIDFASSPFRVQAGRGLWPRGAAPRRAGVSAFGFGGTNAHVVVDEPPAAAARPVPVDEDGPELLVLSARSASALDAATDRLAAALAGDSADGGLAGTATLHDVAQTLALGRRAFAHRRIVVAADLSSAARALRRRDPVATAAAEVSGPPPRVVHAFAPCGTAELGAAAALYGSEPRFRDAADHCAKAFAAVADGDVLDAVLAPPTDTPARAALAVPAQVLVGYALSEFWSAWGIAPDAVLGAGAGELVAATVAGVLELKDACRLAVLLGRLQDGAGEPAPGAAMLPAASAEEFAAAAAAAASHDPRLPIASGVTAEWLDAAQVRSAAYWRALVAAPTDLGAALGAVLSDAGTVVFDLAPGRPFAAAARSVREVPTDRVVAALPRPRDPAPAAESLVRALGRLWLAGAEPRWAERAADRPWRRVGLPTYPFERTRYWLAAPTQAAAPAADPSSPAPVDNLGHDLLDALVLDSAAQQVYETRFAIARQWVLSEHRLLDEAIVPGTTYLEMARAAASRLLCRPVAELADVEFLIPLLVRADAVALVHTTVREVDDGVEFTVAGRRPSSDSGRPEWTLHARGRVRALATDAGDPPSLAELQQRCTIASIDRKTLAGPHAVMSFGGRWNQSLQSVDVGDHVAVGRLELPVDYRDELARLDLHPALLDLATGFGSWAVLDESSDADEVRADGAFYLPLSYDRLRMYGPIPAEVYSAMRTDPATAVDSSGQIRQADVTVYAPDGSVVLDIRGFTVKRVTDPQTTVSRLRRDELFHAVEWLPAPVAPAGGAAGRVLLLDLAGTGEQVAARLRAAGAAVEVAPGGDEDRLRAVLEQFAPSNDDTVVVVADGSGPDVTASPSDTRAHVDRDLLGLFAFARALSATERAPGGVVVLSSAVHDVTGAEGRLAPLAAALFGLALVIEHENEGVRCRCLDLDAEVPGELVLRELAARDEPALIAYRGGARYRAVLVAVDIAAPREDEPALAPESVVLVTGGLGGLGLAVAGQLARTVPGVRLALVSRRGLSGEDGTDPRAARARGAVDELRRVGADVRCYAANVTDERAMGGLVADVRAAWGPIGLVVHAAGVAGDGFVLRKGAAVFRDTVAPKIEGAVVLDAVTRNGPAPLIVAFGSTAALFGAAGQSDYVAANAFLDAWAAWRQREGRPTVTIDWTDWTETGMAADHDVAPDQGFFASIAPALALPAFDAVLRRAVDAPGTTRLIAGAINQPLLANAGRAAIEQRLARAPVGLSPALARTIADAGAPAAPPESTAGKGSGAATLPPVELSGRDDDAYSDTERLVAAVWGLELGRSEIPVGAALFDLGCDSLIALRIAQGVQRRHGRPVKLAALFQHPTVAEFARHLDGAADRNDSDPSPPAGGNEGDTP